MEKKHERLTEINQPCPESDERMAYDEIVREELPRIEREAKKIISNLLKLIRESAGVKPQASKYFSAHDSSEIFREAICELEKIITERAKSKSAYEWSFHLTRLPAYVFSGSLLTTRAYDVALAKTLLGKSDFFVKGGICEITKTLFEKNRFVSVKREKIIDTLEVFWLIRVLSNMHSCYRKSSKGFEFRFYDD